MEEIQSKIAKLIEVVVTPLINYPEDFIVNTKTDDKIVYADIIVHPDDISRVIGRHGRVIKSVRTLARAIASQVHIQAEVEIYE